jgi:hypothetical protein
MSPYTAAWNPRNSDNHSNHVIAKAVFFRLKQSPAKWRSFFDEIRPFNGRLLRHTRHLPR